MKRILLLLAIVAIFLALWQSFREIPVYVIGQPASTGSLQSEKEAPIFNRLSAQTGLPITVTYHAMNDVGFRDTHQLHMIRDGQFDLVSLRFIQNSDAEPSLFGIDLVGLNTDWDKAQAVVREYSPTVDRYLQETFHAKLLGIWTFGPQVFFCKKPIQSVRDIQGLKVRVASASIANLIESLGGVPAIIAFDETKNALAIGLVDCAITSSASGNFAGWPQHTEYFFPLVVHFGLNGFAVSLRKWGNFSRTEQEIMQAAFDEYVADVWTYSQQLDRDTADCNTGRSCVHGTPYNMTLVVPSPQDVQALQHIATTKLIPEWFKECDRAHPGCSKEWIEKVGQIAH